MKKTGRVDRRRQERFVLKATSIVLPVGGDMRDALELCTTDISANGAFFATDKPLPTGASVSITIFLIIAAVKNLLGQPGRVRITTEGKVVRSCPAGMGVAFARRYHLEPAEQS